MLTFLFVRSQSDSRTKEGVGAQSGLPYCALEDHLVVPTGDEVSISVQRKGSNAYLIKLRNESDKQIFMSFTPSDDDRVTFISYIRERRNPSGVFTALHDGNDYAPKLQALDSGREVSFEYFETDRGEFRLIIAYLTDGQIVSVLNNPNCLFKLSENNLRRIESAKGRIVTPVMSIRKQIPVLPN